MRISSWMAALAFTAGSTVGAHALEAVPSFGTTAAGANPGALDMSEHLPANAPPGPLPVVVVLHGCGQTGQALATQAGWVALADAHGFALVVAGQRAANNQGTCFNWFEPGDIARGQGEAASIRNMVAHFAERHSLDASRVFVTGLSAGGAMAAVVLATYPEVFAAGGILAGVAYRCAESVGDAFGCMGSGRALTAQQWGDRVRAGDPQHTGAFPRVALWHGTADTTVNVVNADHLQTQWKDVHALTVAPVSGSAGNHSWQRWTVNNAVVLEDHRINGMGHGAPVDPGNGSEQCGTAAPFVLDVDVCSSRWLARFFGLAPPAPVVDTDAGTPPVTDAGAGSTGSSSSGGTGSSGAGSSSRSGGSSSGDAGTTQPVADGGGQGDSTSSSGGGGGGGACACAATTQEDRNAPLECGAVLALAAFAVRRRRVR